MKTNNENEDVAKLNGCYIEVWKQLVLDVMKPYQSRLALSYIEYKASSITFDYTKSDPMWGTMQARSLLQSLNICLQNLPLDVKYDKGYVMVMMKQINKGTVVKNVLAWIDKTNSDFMRSKNNINLI